jgi:ABC-2 type transport system ATP-binding protein
VIEIRDLYKYYGDRKAIGPLSFSIEQGEIVGLLGLNGAGKTTTLRILACDLLPSSGQVRVDGFDVVESPHDVRKRIGYLPDTPPLYLEMTVREFLRFAVRLRGVSDPGGRRVDDAIGAAQLEEVADDLLSSLSHGFRQRVGIAQAIVHDPRLLVLDEPISGLDPVQIVEMRELLKSLRGRHTILLSSHILSEISETCDRILVIQNGQIGASGTEAELTAMLNPGVFAEVTVRGERALIESTVSSVAGVRSARVTPSPDGAENVFVAHVEADHDVREALCRALVAADLGILEVSRKRRELESIFLQLTGDSGGEDSAPSAGSNATKRDRSRGAPLGA